MYPAQPPRRFSPQDPMAEERREVRKTGNFIGMTMIVLLALMTFVFSFILVALTFVGFANMNDVESGFYGMKYETFMLIYSLIYIIDMAVAAPLIALITNRRINPFARFSSPDNSDKKRVGFLSAALAVGAGMGVTIIANLVVGYMAAFFEQIGLKTPETPDFVQSTPTGLILGVFVLTVLPALLEEMLFRGYVLRMLMQFGEGKAIVISSILFGFMHGNVVQIPFAFLLGLAMGFLTVRTRSIWPAVALHFFTNFLSVILQYFTMDLSDPRIASLIILGVYLVVGLIGMTCFIILCATGNPIVARKNKPQIQAYNPQAPLCNPQVQTYNPQYYPTYPTNGYAPTPYPYPYQQPYQQPSMATPPRTKLTERERLSELLTSPSLIVSGVLFVLILLMNTFLS